MDQAARTKPLSIALVVIGLMFIVAIWPLTMFWPAGWAWHTGGRGYYLEMILAIYATLGVFLLLAARAPLRNLSLIWFTVWSSIAHAGVMAIQSLEPGRRGHLLGDVPALLIVAAVLGGLTTRATRP